MWAVIVVSAVGTIGAFTIPNVRLVVCAAAICAIAALAACGYMWLATRD